MNWPIRLERHEELRRNLAAIVGLQVIPIAQPADRMAISSKETELGLRFNEQHREFLAAANGYTAYCCGTISLLAVEDFVHSELYRLGVRNISALSGAALGVHKRNRRKLLPIAVGKSTLDVICMVKEANTVLPPVIWFNNVEPWEFQDLTAFFRQATSDLQTMISRKSAPLGK